MFEIPVIVNEIYLWKYFLLLTLLIFSLMEVFLIEKRTYWGGLPASVWILIWGLTLTLFAFIEGWKITITTPG